MVRHDDYYCTTVVNSDSEIPPEVLAHMDKVLKYVSDSSEIIEMRCGQVEQITALGWQGPNAYGLEPVVHSPWTHLTARYWLPSDDEAADLYVMRCVLPHIRDPWTFLGSIAQASPGSLVLIEFQRLEWILDQRN